MLGSAACGDDSTDSALIVGVVLSAPTCPTEPATTTGDSVGDAAASDDPCAPQPVEGAVVVALDDGAEVARATSAADGTFELEVDEGDLTLDPQPVEGLLVAAEPVAVSVAAGATVEVDPLVYDTGIR